MKNSVLVRPICKSDLPYAQRVVDLAFETIRHIYRPLRAAHINRPQGSGIPHGLVALKGDRIVGTVRYAFDEDRLHLVALATHPAFRRQGIAGQLIAALTEIGRHHGQRALSLSSIRETGNIPIFDRLGFDMMLEYPAKDLISVQGEVLHEVYMERDLSGVWPST